jgi:hypothetical protein
VAQGRVHLGGKEEKEKEGQGEGFLDDVGRELWEKERGRGRGRGAHLFAEPD